MLLANPVKEVLDVDRSIVRMNKKRLRKKVMIEKCIDVAPMLLATPVQPEHL
jgi:hypothetical protein